MTRRRAEIAGAGYAGLVAATRLAQAGWSVRVHEAASEHRPVGSGLYVFGFAQAALERIGVMPQLLARASQPRRRIICIDGERRSVTELEGVVTTTRARLHQVLLQGAAESGVEVRTGTPARAAGADGTLHLADGSDAAADLVIAADGARSTVAAASGITQQRVRHKDGITRVLMDRTGMRGPEWDDIRDMYDYRIRPLRVLYTPCGPDLFYLCLMSPEGDDRAAAVPVDIALWQRSFPVLSPAWGRIGTAGRHDRYGTLRLDRWTQGRFAVVGDAAHAMPSSLGQGAGVSMMNALALADAVADASPAEVPGALAAWEATNRPLIERWQAQAEQVATERSLAGAVHPGYDLAAERGTPLEVHG